MAREAVVAVSTGVKGMLKCMEGTTSTFSSCSSTGARGRGLFTGVFAIAGVATRGEARGERAGDWATFAGEDDDE